MHLEAHVGIWGKLIPLFGSYSYAPPPPPGRRSCVKWGELCSVAVSRDQEQKGLISQLVLMSSPFVLRRVLAEGAEHSF